MTVEEIAELLMRSTENVQAALREPLTREQEETMKEYLLPVKKVSQRHTGLKLTKPEASF